MTLREIREKAFLTQKEVADYVGVTVGTVSTWERGAKRPETRAIRRLAEIYKIRPEDIVASFEETVAARTGMTTQQDAISDDD